MKMVRTRAALAALLLACGSGSIALAQPDVIVGDLPSVANWGTLGGVRGYSVGTTSCNIGDQPLEWEDTPGGGYAGNIYPVISGNVYRLSNGRFEQLGQQWLKHGFCALNGNVCSTCPQQSNPACRFLMPGCSDPYGASLNGSQGGLGPKYEINPSTGFIPLNWTVNGSTGSTGNVIYKRIQVNESDLTTAGAIYFVASLYMHPQDAASDRDNNSQSYRRVTVNTGTFDLATVGSTFRQSPAIFAWRDFGNGIGSGGGSPDSSVQLAAIDVPGDGRFWVGCKVIDLGNGSYRYEYAVQNLTSHRAADGFTIPLQAGTSLSGVSFKDVAYHSGELQKSDDWAPTVTSNALTFTMPDLYANDQEENALRWDTIYNFSFIANAAPVGGQVNLDLFLTGTPGNMTAALPVPGTPGAPTPPINDNCANAINLGSGNTSVFFDTTLATTDGPAETLCNNAGSNQVGQDVWYTFTTAADCAGDVTLSLCDSTFDTKLAVYTGGACPTATDTAIACNDDSTVCTNNLRSNLTFAATANTTYRVRVGGYNAAVGTGTLTLTLPNCGPVPPSNDDCANAPFVADGVPVTGSTVLATPTASLTGQCGGSSGNADVWFKYKPTTSGQVIIGTCGSDYDTVLGLFSACGGTSLGCNDDHGQGGAFCGEGLSSRIAFNMTAGTTYYIRVSGYNSNTGDFTLTVTGGGGAIPPQNDDCSGRAGLGLGTQAFTLSGASTDGPAHNGTQIYNDVWFNHPGLCTGDLAIRVCVTDGFTPAVAIYSGVGCDNLASRFLGFATPNLQACPAGGVQYIATGMTAGVPLTIRVGNAVNAAAGAGEIELECLPSGPVCNDIDFNNDGLFPDDSDLVDLLSVLAGGACSTGDCDEIDFNNDGLFPDDADLTAFLRVLAGGEC